MYFSCPSLPLFEHKVQLTSLQIKSLTTPFEIVPAPGDGLIFIPTMVALELVVGSEVLTAGVGDDLRLTWEPPGSAILGFSIIGTAVIAAAVNTLVYDYGTQAVRESSTCINRNISLHNTGADYAGNASNDALLNVCTWCRLISF